MASVSGGIALLVHGQLSGLLAVLLIPLGVTAVFVGATNTGLRSLERSTQKLIEEIDGALGSTATFT